MSIAASLDKAASEIAEVGRFLADRGWSPATSSNYSVKIDETYIAITRSGIDKFQIAPQDILLIDQQGEVQAATPGKSSAETLIHTAIYKCSPDAHSVLHTHSPHNTRLSLKFLKDGQISFEGYEMQKGVAGTTTHESVVTLPILPNSQDMSAFSKDVEILLNQKPNIKGFLIAGHGLYAWGKDLPEAKRHIETYEFLITCKVLELSGV